MKISAILKKEYFNDIVFFDLESLSHAQYKDDIAVFRFKEGNEIIVFRNEADKKNSLREIFLDVYSSWKNYIDNMPKGNFITYE